jgi:hypothetical protein
MTKLKDVISYIHNAYIERNKDLSVDKLIKMIFLCDWKFAIVCGAQLSGIEWRVKDLQPWMDEKSVDALVETLAKIRVGSLLRLTARFKKGEKDVIDSIIGTSFSKNASEFEQLVTSTYPVITQNNKKNVCIDLIALAKIYKDEVRPLIPT